MPDNRDICYSCGHEWRWHFEKQRHGHQLYECWRPQYHNDNCGCTKRKRKPTPKVSKTPTPEANKSLYDLLKEDEDG